PSNHRRNRPVCFSLSGSVPANPEVDGLAESILPQTIMFTGPAHLTESGILFHYQSVLNVGGPVSMKAVYRPKSPSSRQRRARSWLELVKTQWCPNRL